MVGKLHTVAWFSRVMQVPDNATLADFYTGHISFRV